MPLKTRAWDAAEYLETPTDIIAFLEAALEEAPDDPVYLIHVIGVAARAHGMSKLARDTGITRRGLYKALDTAGNPSFATIYSVLRALGVRIRAEAESRASTRRRRVSPALAAKRSRAGIRGRVRAP